MASTTASARAQADDAVLAASDGYAMTSSPSPWHAVVGALGVVGVAAATIGWSAIGTCASAGGDESGRWWAPGGLLVLSLYMAIYGALGVRRSLRTWRAPDGSRLVRERYRLPGDAAEAERLWRMLGEARVADLPRLPEGRRGPIVVSTYVARRSRTMHATVVHGAGPGQRTWPVVVRDDPGAASFAWGRGADEASNPISI